MTTSQDTMTAAAYRGQEATSSVLHIWADSVKKLFGPPYGYGKVPGAAGVVDCYFDFAEHVLDIQREFVKSLVAYDHGGHDPSYDRGHDPKDMHYAAKGDVVKDGASTKG